MSHLIDSIPQGYHLYMYDDCGVEGRQPHVGMDDSILWTFNTSDTDADIKQRSAVFSNKEVKAAYNDLDPKLDYVLALTYASDHVYKRVQSLEADGVELHPPMPLPNAKATRVIVKVPRSVTEDGSMTLRFRLHGEANATVSIIELWASAPPPVTIRLGPIWGTRSQMRGSVLDLAYNPVPGVEVQISKWIHTGVLASAVTGSDGTYQFDRKVIEGLHLGNPQLTAVHDGQEVHQVFLTHGLFFNPVRYRPIPQKVAGLANNQMILDGVWKIDPTASSKPLAGAAWGDFKVPGQWYQQGYDLPQDKPVAVATEFTIPKEWAGYRIFLRFDAIHAGTDYFLNGKSLGHSENLFTPVEWEITDEARPGEANRLDLKMLVATKSEALSYSSGYAFHNLGGIDRSVRIFALPRINIANVHVNIDLDKKYRDATMDLAIILDNPNEEDEKDMLLRLTLLDANGKPVDHSTPFETVSVLSHGRWSAPYQTYVPNPHKWTAETPYLYKMILEFKKGEDVWERIEQNIGFKKVEIKGKQLCVNGKRIKLAGVCHHEMDPLTGRADAMRHGEEDVRMIKAANLNFIRTSHYPPSKELLDAADRLGMYVEVEAPFCWVGPTDDMGSLGKVLTPTSAMVDYCHAHPSVLHWSVANESAYNDLFVQSDKLIRELDPTRPTTFNNPDSERVSSIANLHYPGMPFDASLKDDPRPILLGECFFPVCHEQTDVDIDPGLRELWGFGNSDPTTDWAKSCAADHLMAPLKPGIHPGGWSYIYNSDHLIGGAIFASHDDAFYFEGGKRAGYAWHHGFWGLIDYWRRPKPEWWLSKLIFSPVWFPQRHVDFKPGQASVRVPVENRYSFTDLSALKFAWEIGKKRGTLKVALPPASNGHMDIPVPAGTQAGDRIVLRVTDAHGVLINALAIHLGKDKPKPLPRPKSGPPTWHDDGKSVTIQGKGFSLVFDRTTGDFDAGNPKHNAPVIAFPSVHITRYDFGDLNGPKSPNYAVFPDAKTRAVDGVSVESRSTGVEITVRDHYDGFAGSMTWLLDSNGVGRVSYDYTYSGDATAPASGSGAVAPRTGEQMDTREQGIRFLLKPACDEAKWRRWSEWDIYPDDFIGRTEGMAKAHRDKKLGEAVWNKRPSWPWSLDETDLGTADFRSIKFNVYEASLVAPNGSGLEVRANADAHVRPALCPQGVRMHVLSQCRLGQILLKPGDHIKGEFTVELLYPSR